MNRPIGYNAAATYRPHGYGRNLPGYRVINGYKTNSVNSIGSFGNMNKPGQYATRSYNARRL